MYWAVAQKATVNPSYLIRRQRSRKMKEARQKFDAGVRWLDSGMFWLKLKKPPPWRGPRWADWANHDWDTKLYCAKRVWFSPLLPWLLHQPVDGEGEEVVEEDDDAEAEQEEVDDHLDAPPSAASLPPASLLRRGFAFPESLASTGTVRLHRRRILNILYLSTHTLTNSIFVHFCWKENILKIYILHIHTQTKQIFVHIYF